MKKLLVYSLVLFLLIFSCKEKQKKKNYLTLVKYTDSTYIHRTDSLQIDSITPSITGFVKIYGNYGIEESYEKGKMNQGVRTGKWQRSFYGKEISEIITYNSKGELEGEYKEFFSPGGILMTAFYYKNNQQLGEQKEFYSNGNLALLYYKDINDNYINKYLALSEKGDTLYYVNLGKAGNGYLKEYNRFGTLEKEGRLVNGTYLGMVKEYEYDSGLDRYIFVHIYNYTPDSTTFIKKLKLN